MKKLTRKLFISVLVAVFAFVALGTSTYAWITMSTTADVQAIDATVDAGEAGIELSETGADGTWTSVLDLQNVPTNKLNDLTSPDGKTFYDLYSTGNTMDYKYQDGNKVSTTVGYIQHKFFLRRSPSADKAITVNVNGAKVVFANGAADTTATYGSTTVNNLYAANAARFSIEIGGKIVVYQNGQGDDYLGNTLGYIESGFAHQYAAYQNITVPVPGTNDLPETLTPNTDSAALVTLDSDAAVEVTIRIWIEGFDNECHAKVLNQSFSIAFGFEKADA